MSTAARHALAASVCRAEAAERASDLLRHLYGLADQRSAGCATKADADDQPVLTAYLRRLSRPIPRRRKALRPIDPVRPSSQF